jgi:hypothetical protein
MCLSSKTVWFPPDDFVLKLNIGALKMMVLDMSHIPVCAVFFKLLKWHL